MKLLIAFGHAVSDGQLTAYQPVLDRECAQLGADATILLRADRDGRPLTRGDRLTSLRARARHIDLEWVQAEEIGMAGSDGRDRRITSAADRVVLFAGMAITPDLRRLQRFAQEAGVPVSVWETVCDMPSRAA